MNLVDMAKLLATVSLIDPRVSRRNDDEKELMAKAWLVVVGEEVPYDFAAKCAQEHYRNSGEVFMPVHIVSQWKLKRSKELEKEHFKQITAPVEAVPMPESVRALIREIQNRTA